MGSNRVALVSVASELGAAVQRKAAELASEIGERFNDPVFCNALTDVTMRMLIARGVPLETARSIVEAHYAQAELERRERGSA